MEREEREVWFFKQFFFEEREFPKFQTLMRIIEIKKELFRLYIILSLTRLHTEKHD